MITTLREGMVITHPDLLDGREIIILDVWEQEPRWNEFNRQTSYENRIKFKPLAADGKYDGNAESLYFSTAHVYSDSLKEAEIKIVRQMRRTYV